MAGLFKSFEKLLSSSQLTKNTHKFIVRFPNSYFCPAALYFDPSYLETGLPQGHGHDAFTLSVTTAALLRQKINYQNALQQVTEQSASDQRQSLQDLAQELKKKVQQQNSLITQQYQELLLMLNSRQFDFPVQTAVDALYISSFSELELPQQTLKEVLLPNILQKIHYASTLTLIDLAKSLQKSNIWDAALWKALVDNLNKRNLPWELESVGYHGWQTDVYEYLSDKQIENYSKACNDPLVAYWEDLKNGNDLVAKSKRWIACWRDSLFNRVILPVFYRENRVEYTFGTRRASQEKDALSYALKQASEKIQELKENADKIARRC